MQANHLRILLGWPIFALGLFASGLALADDSDPAAIEQRLRALETTPERKALVRAPAEQARTALKRVLDARTAGDAAHAVELAALASDWVNLAANVVRAVEVEKEVATQQTRLSELEQKRRRTETLLEATIAQRERTREEIKRSSAPPLTGAATTSAPQTSSPAKAIKPRAESKLSIKVREASKPSSSASTQARQSVPPAAPPQPSTLPREK